MRFLIVRKADAATEAGEAPSHELLVAMAQHHDTLAAEGRLHGGEGLKASRHGVRVRFAGDEITVTEGPFAETHELVAGFSLIEADSLDHATEWVREWPMADAGGNVCIDIRSAGCPGGLAGIAVTDVDDDTSTTRFAILLKADEASERDVNPGSAVLSAMERANRQGVEAGFLLAGEGLKSSASARRVRFTRGEATLIDGPFAEMKELVAGFWIVRMASMEDAVAWVKTFPYPRRESATVEIRPLFELAELMATAT
ncbi:hypothetical protein FHW69_001109 [Luteibacter sp. Sphag1AF]|uniref:YciI family protein n=1 Tax=Luteibacter sp. Sphag1AF TaxID=2587031 RepID=UPI0016185435|nr:YciI family protein [Luteibacter sp. Sphag1AF]MBB3226519.1 hypothetical protein [Luteibacter sp. Sphag1AF]